MSKTRMLLLFLMLALAGAGAVAGVGPVGDGVVAQVNRKVITLGDVMEASEPAARELRTRYSGDELTAKVREARREALEGLIEKQLILDAYEKQEQKIPEQFIEERISSIINENFHGDRSELMGALAKDGLTFEQWRQNVRESILASSMRRSTIDQKIRISPETIRSHYDSHPDDFMIPGKVKAHVIALPSTVADPAEQEALLEQIYSRLGAGESFAAVAEALGSSEGGDWGWVEPRSYRPELDAALRELAAGTYSEAPVQSAGLTYILYVAEKEPTSKMPYEVAQPRIERELRQAAIKEAYLAWMERLKATSTVRIVKDDLP